METHCLNVRMLCTSSQWCNVPPRGKSLFSFGYIIAWFCGVCDCFGGPILPKQASCAATPLSVAWSVRCSAFCGFAWTFYDAVLSMQEMTKACISVDNLVTTSMSRQSVDRGALVTGSQAGVWAWTSYLYSESADSCVACRARNSVCEWSSFAVWKALQFV